MDGIDRNRLNLALWGAQGVLFVAFEAIGLLKACVPAEELPAALRLWTGADHLQLIGLAEVLCCLLLVLPAATRILPLLTPVAAAGCVALSLLGALAPASGAGVTPAVDLLLAALAAFVAWGRFLALPIAPWNEEAAPTPAGRPVVRPAAIAFLRNLSEPRA